MIPLKPEKTSKGGKYLSGDQWSFMEFRTLKGFVGFKDLPKNKLQKEMSHPPVSGEWLLRLIKWGGFSEGTRFAENFVITLENSKQKLVPFPHHPFFLLSHPPTLAHDSHSNVISICKIHFDLGNEDILQPDFGINV